MNGKILLSLALALSLALTAAQTSAQSSPLSGVSLPPDMALALANEKPLTQADIDLYRKVLPKTGLVAHDPAAVARLYQEAGLSEVRFNYVVSKIGLGMSLAAGATPHQLELEKTPEVLRPTSAEIDLVKKNISGLQRASREMIANMQKAQ